MATVCFDRVTKNYHGRRRSGAVRAVSELSLFVEDGAFMVLVGPSGCGKTTTLRLAAGLEQPDQGRIFIRDRDVTRVPPQKRDVAMVFQHQALYSHMTVAENLSFGLRMRGASRPLIRQKVESVSQSLEIRHLHDRRPARLSGGEQQRVALGRALVRTPTTFLLDEPLSNLDMALRLKLRGEIKRIQREVNATMIYVTHDQEEAMTLADRILLLRNGVVQQHGPPLDLYENPANRFVASFFGSPPMNFLEGRLERHEGDLFFASSLGRIRLPRQLTNRPSTNQGLEKISLGIRPEHLRISERGQCTVTGRSNRDREGFVPFTILPVYSTEETGSLTRVCARGAGGERLTVIVTNSERPMQGDPVHLSVDVSQVHLFDGIRGTRMFPQSG